MKRIFLLLIVTLAFDAGAAPPTPASDIPTNAPSSIELHDQFDAPQKLSFPTTNITMLIIADRAGSEQISGWITPLKKRFDTRISFRGLADVSTVPRLLRGMVRTKFQKSQSYPVMMDWSGETVKALTYVPEKANVLLLDPHGQILKRISGEATPGAVADLCNAVEEALAKLSGEVARP